MISSRTSPLFRNVRHRAMITLTSPLRTRLIDISSSCWTIYRWFEIIHEWELSIGLEFKSIASKNIQPDMNYIFF